MFQIILLCSSLFLQIVISEDMSPFMDERESWSNDEIQRSFGSDIELTEKEQIVNDKMMTQKQDELNAGFYNVEFYPPAMHFFWAKPKIWQSKIFHFIRMMPKGAALHMNFDGMLSFLEFENLIKENEDLLYVCRKPDDEGYFTEKFYYQFSNSRPKKHCFASAKGLEPGTLQRTLSLIFDVDKETNRPVSYDHPDKRYVWMKYQNVLKTVRGMLNYKPIFEQYLNNALQELYDDNIQYVEIRTQLTWLEDEQGKMHKNSEYTAEFLLNVVNKFKESHPDMLDIRIVFSPPRSVEPKTMGNYLEQYKNFKKLYNDFIEGFDIDGYEDSDDRPLSEFFQTFKNEKNVNYIFSAGETNWFGLPIDYNLFDAILLNSSRIDHGNAIPKHPRLMEEIKNRDIPIVITPIRSQILKLVEDLRNHPAGILFSQNFPLIISADAPGFYNSKGLSYDFYYAFNAIASSQADLRTLKKLAINSIKYAGLDKTMTDKLMILWQKKWDEFIEEVL